MSPAPRAGTRSAGVRTTGSGTGRSADRAARADATASRTRDALVLSLPAELETASPAELDEDDAPLDEEFPDLAREDDDEPAEGAEEWADDVPRALPPRAQIVLGLASGLPTVWLPGPHEATLLDPELAAAALARQARLARYAAEICRSARATLAAPTLADAFEALEPRSAADVAVALGIDKARISEDSDVVVRIPAGLVHLGFFTSKKANDRVVEFLWRQPDLLEADARALQRRATAHLGGREGAGRGVVPWLHTARLAPGVVRSAAARFARDPRNADAQADALRGALHEAAGLLGITGLEPRRGRPVAERGLYGGLL